MIARQKWVPCLAAAMMLFGVGRMVLGAQPAAVADTSDEFAEMSLEDLMNVEVTSVSKHAQKASEAPAAITVITSEDIERSGMQRIPELLRLAPGMSVARIDANKWAISSRGFSEQFATKLLTLMDGRTLYHPLTAGTIWETVDYVLPDIDRIEVIRGPGATLWGSNAVNGVINITTKSARDTQGVLVGGTYSTDTDRSASVRYGGKFGDSTYYRVWGKFSDSRAFDDTLGDDWHAAMGGFRIDHYGTDRDTLMLQGTAQSMDMPDFEIYRDSAGGIAREPYGAENFLGNVVARWRHEISDRSDLAVQLYYDKADGNQYGVGADLDTYDLDVQYRFPLDDRHQVIVGAGYRYSRYDAVATDLVGFAQTTDNLHRATAFIQDDITLVPDKLHLIVGTKVEHTTYDGWNIQPSARVLWTPDDRTTVWGSVSRAVRTATTAERSAKQTFGVMPGPGGVPIELTLVGNPDFEPEDLTAYEIGYRVKPHDRLTLDFAAFYNRHTGLRTLEQSGQTFDPNPPRIIAASTFQNAIKSHSYGLEVAANFNVSNNWRLAGSYSLLFVNAENTFPGATPTAEKTLETGEPENQFQIHSYYDLSRKLSLDASVYYTDSLLAYNVPSNLRVDLALTWRPKENLALKVGVQNLLDDQHPEFGDIFAATSETPRTVFGQLTWEF